MKKSISIFLLCLSALSISAQQPVSPNGKLAVANTAKGIQVCYQNSKTLNIPVLGYEGIKNGKLKWKFTGMVRPTTR